MSHYSVESGISGQIGFPHVALQCGVWNLRSNRISVYSVTVWSLESLFVRSNKISMCRITLSSLESPVSQRRISVRRITAWSLECMLNKE